MQEFSKAVLNGPVIQQKEEVWGIEGIAGGYWWIREAAGEVSVFNWQPVRGGRWNKQMKGFPWMDTESHLEAISRQLNNIFDVQDMKIPENWTFFKVVLAFVLPQRSPFRSHLGLPLSHHKAPPNVLKQKKKKKKRYNLQTGVHYQIPTFKPSFYSLCPLSSASSGITLPRRYGCTSSSVALKIYIYRSTASTELSNGSTWKDRPDPGGAC